MSDEQLRDSDGHPLLGVDEVAELAGVEPSTIRFYNAEANKHREEGTVTEFDLPEPVKRVKRRITRSDGRPVGVWTPVWREDAITAWLGNKRGPGGRVILRGGQPPENTELGCGRGRVQVRGGGRGVHQRVPCAAATAQVPSHR